MKRVMEGGDWTLFSPSDVPDLHDKWGRAFEEAYVRYEDARGARRAQALQEDPRGAAVAQDAVDAVRDRASVDHVQGRLQRALAAAARGHRAQLEPVHRDHAQHQRHRDRRVQPGLGQPARAHEVETARRLGARPRQAAADDPHRDADARQRHRHQLLRGGQGAQFEPQAPPGGPRHHGLPGLPAPARTRRTRPTRRWRSPTARWRRSATTPTGRRPSSPRSAAATRRTRAACGTAASCRRTR